MLYGKYVYLGPLRYFDVVSFESPLPGTRVSKYKRELQQLVTPVEGGPPVWLKVPAYNDFGLISE